MKEPTVKELFRGAYKELMGKEIKLSGWIRTSRLSKTFGFIELNDGSFFKNIQVVFDDSLPNFEKVGKLSIGSAIQIEGEVVESLGKGQTFEIQAKGVEITGESSMDYPLQKKRHSFEYLRTIAHLRPRTNTFTAVFRVRSLLAHAIHSFFQERGFVYVHTPIITGSDCEGAGDMFQVTTLDLVDIPKNEKGETDFSKDFFGKETNLTVSGQLEVETFCMNFKNVYTFGPAFRAENSHTARHISELWMIEPEIAFADIHDDADLAEEMMRYIIQYILDNAPEELEFFNKFIDKNLLGRLEHVVKSEFERVEYKDAVDILRKAKQDFEYPVEWGTDLQTEHERYLTEEIFKRPVFVLNYPKKIKPFYMRVNDDNETVAAMDLLVPGVGEIIGGSQREERSNVLLQRIEELGLNKQDYWWYLDLRKYGSSPHAGYGLGFERAIMYVTGMKNIRDVIPFPRVPKYAEF